MAVSNTVIETADGSKPGTFQQLVVDEVLQWCDVIDRFIQWQAEHMLRGQPSLRQQEDHRQGLKWLLRLTKLIHSVASDPEFPDQSLLSQLAAQMRQLEESWELFYNQMPAPEAEKILAEAFPNGR